MLRFELLFLPFSQSYELFEQLRKWLTLLDEGEDLLVGDPNVWQG